jgi:hypothetical protein
VSLVRVFFEGNSSLKLPLIQFIAKAVPESHGRIKIQLGKSKEETIKDFLRTLCENPGANVLLLVDSDARDDGKLLGRLKQKVMWQRHAPKKVPLERIHWMVQVMESWFLAEPAALKAYYKRDFKASAVPTRANVEEIPQKDVFRILKQAIKADYDKAAHAPKILELLSPEIVRGRAPNCEQFLTALRAFIA